MDTVATLAFGVELSLLPTGEGGRSTALLNPPDRRWTYRPNWGLPSMTPPEQTGAPVLALSRDKVMPGDSAHAVIVPSSPEMVALWDEEAQPGVVFPMYEGPRICGHATVIWRINVVLPLSDHDERRFLHWLTDPRNPLNDF